LIAVNHESRGICDLWVTMETGCLKLIQGNVADSLQFTFCVLTLGIIWVTELLDQSADYLFLFRFERIFPAVNVRWLQLERSERYRDARQDSKPDSHICIPYLGEFRLIRL
jgi:hypothetical protein